MQILILLFSSHLIVRTKCALLMGCVLFSGCAAMYPKVPILRDEFRLIFRFDENPMPNDSSAVASASWSGDWCIIRVKRAYYNHKCLGHELRHCLEGKWHGDRPTPC